MSSTLMTTKSLSTTKLLVRAAAAVVLFMLLPLLLLPTPVATLLTSDNNNTNNNNSNNTNTNTKHKQELVEREHALKLAQETPHDVQLEFKSTTSTATTTTNISTTTNTNTSLAFVKPRRARREFDLKSSLHNEQKFSLPSVPLPPPPPFPSGTHNFGLNAFSGTGGGLGGGVRLPNAFAGMSSSNAASRGGARCGGVLKARYGVIQTPNFPHKFETPIECVWVIDASELPSLTSSTTSSSSSSSPLANTSIVVYLTQLYVLGGLKFTEFMYYSDDFKVPAHRVFALTEDDVTQVASVQFNSQYLEVRFTMPTLDGTHLRALDRLLDVYGFNITYEVQHEVKPSQCNTLQCRFLGNCYASSDFSSYACSCFAGFSGTDCGHGPLCEDAHSNVCQNGGTCKHIGDAAITCHCPAGFKGNKCEIPEINGTTLGCTSNSSSPSCHRECEFEQPNAGYSVLKVSRSAARTGKTRYEVTIRLGTNLTAFYRHAETERRGADQLPSLLEKHLARVLRNFNVTRINDLELISNNSDRLDITFHFFGIKGDSSRIREAITRMVERGRIGNITLVSNYHHFDENPPLNLMELTVNQQPAVREDSEFIISCTAQGSSRMQFRWYKDGAIVNASRATREIWTTVLPPENKDVFTAILGVTKASNIDEGVYTCKVTDWGVEQCRSIHVHVKSPPHLRVDPASVTLERGDSLRVRCLSPGNDDIKRYAQLGYSWTRNGVLFQSASSTAMWEDLYPDGSILKINNIQKSAEYACLVSNTVKPVLKSVYINVIERNAVHVCAMEQSYGVRWPRSAPGVPIIADCPRGFTGHSERVCEQSATNNSAWLLPDFASCVRDDLLVIYNRFRALRSGFQLTNSSNILKACFDYTIHRHKSFLPGEAAFLIDMLHELDNYLQSKGTQLEREMAAEIILHILDKVMQNAQSLNSQQQIKKLQLLTQSAALNRETIAASQLATSSGSSAGANTLQASITASSSSSSSSSSVSSASSSSAAAQSSKSSLGSQAATSADLSPANNVGKLQLQQRVGVAGAGSGAGSGSGAGIESNTPADANSILTVDEDTLSLDRLNSLRIYMTSVKTLPFNLRIYGDDLFSDQLYMDIGFSSRLLHIMANSTIFASVISYKNLKSFLPKTYYTRGSDPKDADYVLASRIIQTWLFQSNRSNDNLREPLDLPFESGHVEIIFQHETVAKDGNWVAVCGHDYKASFESSWRSDLCITKHLMDNITRCICPLSGTYVVMLTKRNHNASQTAVPQRPLFVIVSCACCLLQSCSAFMILLPIWCNRKCAITFLKMQFCVSTSSVMLIFLLGFLKMLPVNWHAIISSSLGSLLLLGVSTLIAIALVIHTELVPKKYLQISHRSGAAGGAAAAGKPDFSLIESAARSAAATATEQQQQRRSSTRGSSSTDGLTSITQISEAVGGGGGGGVGVGTLKRHSMALGVAIESEAVGGAASRPVSLSARQRPGEQLLVLPAAGIGGAIGISWLLPLLFAIAAPLICSINGKWPTNWWLEVMSATEMGAAGESSTATSLSTSSSSSSSTRSYESVFDATHSLINGDNLLLAATTTSHLEATTSASSSTSSSSSAWSPSTSAATTSTSSSITSTSSDTTHPHAAQFADATLPETEMTHAAAYAAIGASTSHSYQATDASTGADAATDGDDGLGSPSLSFVIFVCVDLLFILLFLALFAILMKKLLWLSHKNRNVHTHPLDKFNMALRRRLGLLYRAGTLLLVKLCTDGFFIAYVNTTQDALWSYPFGISAIALGTAILFCFVIKAECQLRGPSYTGSGHGSGSGGGGGGGNALKAKFSTSKASLDDNYSVNSPLSFFAAQEKERENNSGAPPAGHPQKQGLELSVSSTGGGGGVGSGSGGVVGQQLPLTIISTAPRCQILPPGPPPSSVESFLSGATTNLERCKAELASGNFAACMSDKLLLGGGSSANPGSSALASPATRCCSLLGGDAGSGGGGGGVSTLPAAAMLGGVAYYDAYAGGALTMTGSLSRRALHLQHHHPHSHQQQQQQQQHQPEFVGLQTLDILQGVAADSSIIGIRTSNMLPPSAQYHHQQQQQQQQQLPATLLLQHNPYVDATMLPMPHPPTLVSVRHFGHQAPPPASTANGRSMPGATATATTTTTTTTTATTSVTTQTPKTQKRVTIMEPTTHTFDPMLPTMSVAISAPTVTLADAVPPTTTATASVSTLAATTADMKTSAKTDGMLVRITHDLDYLLNRRDSPAADDDDDDDDDDIPPPPLPPAAATAAAAASVLDAEVRQHDVIMEENETET